MRVLAVELFLLELPLNEPFVASHGETRSRAIVMARVATTIGPGWGECSALPAATYTDESATGCYRSIGDELAPGLIGRPLPDDPSPETVAVPGRDRGRPMATACLEMAIIDASLRSRGLSLARWLGAERDRVPAGVSIGLGTVGGTVAAAERLVADGFGRLKVKIEPGHDARLVEALRRALPAVELQVDANGAYDEADVDDVARLVVGAAERGVDAIEQPFAPAAEAAAVELIERLASGRAVPVVADEAVSSVRDAARLLARGAMSGLSIKPARVGGIAESKRLHDLCLANGLPATAGGMLETGLGRHALAALAALPGFCLTGDVSPASRWLAADPWPDLTMVDGEILVPTGHGVGPEPDEAVLERFTVDRRLVD